MTLQEQREYAATKIMGWHATQRSDRPPYYCENTPQRLEVGRWHPDTDRNQLWLVMEKAHKDEGFMEAMRNKCLSDGRAVFDAEFYFNAWGNPALALEAIVKAHKEAQ